MGRFGPKNHISKDKISVEACEIVQNAQKLPVKTIFTMNQTAVVPMKNARMSKIRHAAAAIDWVVPHRANISMTNVSRYIKIAGRATGMPTHVDHTVQPIWLQSIENGLRQPV